VQCLVPMPVFGGVLKEGEGELRNSNPAFTTDAHPNIHKTGSVPPTLLDSPGDALLRAVGGSVSMFELPVAVDAPLRLNISADEAYAVLPPVEQREDAVHWE
jgi:hypothetical protein